MSLPFARDPAAAAAPTPAAHPATRKLALICAKSGLDECYPVLIMANAARMTGMDVSIFFTFYGLDVVTKNKVDKLWVNMVGNPSTPMPPFLMGLPGMEVMATSMMKKKMAELDLPPPHEMIEMLAASGCKLYGCELAMKMFGRTDDDLLPQVHSVITATDFFDMSEGAQIVFV
ncbi:MAG: DsrE/DsrF/DrsH-like family protein [Sandaracinaceae bacterium]|nr:DsrE/DsrF/DrsH-like family protein [Sandaracinaceae bacterium]